MLGCHMLFENCLITGCVVTLVTGKPNTGMHRRNMGLKARLLDENGAAQLARVSNAVMFSFSVLSKAGFGGARVVTLFTRVSNPQMFGLDVMSQG